ncbi:MULTISPECIES: S9 family peptidase [unclassified Caballeronia]|uniref:alpha/beta hydrolase family protein n=1 Tax=unclassified Caballeronia TaxID=2646786 RepID=UPI00025BC70F|nr:MULTISPECIES: alpha/beta fold hydrolase [unclassified Caballeronia]EKS70252.1 hypothetical protein BURK_019300 [Burkholderia sp. SJ98]MCE4546476.1 alpha/beta hydrolase [Caballeronia sp. PC1]MCE4573050.1 alpha/beta hydrolase [Caballeronia sp. CLC5]
MPSERFDFLGADGQKLAGRLDLPTDEPRAYALFAHCFTCGKDVFAASRIAQALTDHGIAVLRFDFTGLGASEGEFANTNFSSNCNDLVSAAGHLEEVGRAPSILIGHSLGGAAVLASAGYIGVVRAVVTIAAPSDPSHVIGLFKSDVPRIEAEGEADVQIAGRSFRIGKQFLQDAAEHNLSKKVAGLKRPLLVMHSPQDTTVETRNAATIFSAAKHPKSFVSLDGSDHLLSKRRDAVYAASIISAWSARYIE